MALKVIELFGGIGACSNALRRLNIPHEVVDYVEIDKYAVKSYNAIYGTNFEPQDIRKWDKDIEADLIMHGSPCQDFSIAGKQAGGDEGSGTRSSLMYETLRIVSKVRPKYVIWENVKNLLSKKHIHNFNAYIQSMQGLGYNSYYKVLNAKDFGVPQNRERVITISIRNDGLFDSYYIFPDAVALEKRLKDILETSVDEKYYLDCKQAAGFVQKALPGAYGRCFGSKGTVQDVDKECTTLQAAMGEGGGNVPLVTQCDCIPIKTANSKGYDLAEDGDGIDLSYPDSKTRRGRVGHGVSKTIPAVGGSQGVIESYMVVGSTQEHAAVSRDGIVPTLTSSMGCGGGHVPMHNYEYRIRKLTPKECWRLMGFSDEDYEKAAKVNSNSQLYKQAGNSIVVDVLCAVFNNLFKEVQ
jgi:DNA (cytosine-5)-methyltransferase 1